MALQHSHPTPFKGLVPYSEEDAQYFFGREEIRDNIIAHLETWRLTLLYGASGVGKSSVLHAAVIPTIRSLSQQSLDDTRTTPEFSIVTVNAWRDDPVSGLARRIHQHLVQLLGETVPPLPGRPELSAALDQWAASTDCQLYMILDQFEEYFQYHGNEDGPGSFARELPRAIARQSQRFRFLISIREDAVAKLDLFTGRVPNLFDHILRVRPLTVEEARRAIEGPIKQYNTLMNSSEVAIEEELLDVVLKSVQVADLTVARGGAVRESGVDATILQQVMTGLWREDVERDGLRSLRLETFNRLGGARTIVSTHFSSAMGLLSPADQKIAAAVFRYLVTPSGTKIAQTAKDLSLYSEVPEASVTSVLDRLTAADLRIVRAISPPPDHPDEVRYEIFHDVLSGPINEWWRRYENDERVERVRLEGIRERAVVRARYSRRVAGLLAVALILVSALAVYAFAQKTKAQTELVAKRDALQWAQEESLAAVKAAEFAKQQESLALTRAQEAENERKKTAEANKLALNNLALAKAAEAKADEQLRVANTALIAANNARKTDAAQRAAFRLSRRKDKREQAIVEIEKAFAVYNASKDPEDRLATIDTLLNVGEVYLDLGNETDAIKAFDLALNKSKNLFEHAATLTSIGDIYQEIVPKNPYLYDPRAPYVPWSPYAVEFKPKARAILHYEGAIRIYGKLRGDLWAGVKSDHPSFNERTIKSLEAGVNVSLGVAKIDSSDTRQPEQRQQTFDEGVSDIEEGITLYDEAQDHQGKAYALLALAEAKTTINPTPQNREEVMKILQQSLAEYQATSNPKGKIQVLRKMARVGLHPRESTDSLTEIVNIYRSINDKPGTAAALLDVASSLTRLPIDSNNRKAFETRLAEQKRLYLEAADLYEEAQWHDKAAETLMTATDQFAYRSTADAEPLLERAAKLFGRSGRWEHQINALRRLIMINVGSNQEKTNKLLDEISDIASKLLKPEDIAQAQEQLGHGYILAKQFKKADAAVTIAVMNYRARNDKLSELSAQHRIAITYLQESAPDKAIEYLNLALEHGIKSWNGTLYSSLGDAYVWKDVTRAISFYEQARQAFKEKGDGISEAQTMIAMSRVFRDKGRYDEAISYLEQAITLLRASKLYFQIGPALTSLADVYHQKGDIKSAIETYHRADRLFIEEVAAPSYYRVDVLTKLSELYAKTGDLKAAEDYKERAEKLKAGP